GADDLIDADRPGIADGSHAVKAGQVQLELGLDREHHGNERTLSTPVLIRYGLTNRLEGRVEGEGFQRSDHAGHWAPISLGFKVHLADAPSLGVIGRMF